jgi:hypothetical protein
VRLQTSNLALHHLDAGARPIRYKAVCQSRSKILIEMFWVCANTERQE